MTIYELNDLFGMNIGTYIVFKAFDEPYMQSDLCKQDWAKMIKRKPTELIKIIEQMDALISKKTIESNNVIRELADKNVSLKQGSEILKQRNEQLRQENERLKNALRAISETISNYEQTNH